MGIDAAAGRASVDSRMIQKMNQNAATTPITRVRERPSMRLSTHSCASTIVVVLKKKMTPIACTLIFKLFTTKRLRPASSDPVPADHEKDRRDDVANHPAVAGNDAPAFGALFGVIVMLFDGTAVTADGQVRECREQHDAGVEEVEHRERLRSLEIDDARRDERAKADAQVEEHEVHAEGALTMLGGDESAEHR